VGNLDRLTTPDGTPRWSRGLVSRAVRGVSRYFIGSRGVLLEWWGIRGGGMSKGRGGWHLLYFVLCVARHELSLRMFGLR